MIPFHHPYGLSVRPADKYASEGGGWHAARSSRGRPRFHEGLDLVGYNGQPVLAPFGGLVVRVVDPYDDRKDASLLGLLIQPWEGFEIRVLYVDPIKSLVGQMVQPGQVIGYVQSLGNLYPGIIDHTHWEVWINGRRVDPTPFYFPVLAAPAGGSA